MYLPICRRASLQDRPTHALGGHVHYFQFIISTHVCDNEHMLRQKICSLRGRTLAGAAKEDESTGAVGAHRGMNV